MKNLFRQEPSLFFEESFFKKKHFKNYLGSFSQLEAEKKQMLAVTGFETNQKNESIKLHLLVDCEDGVIADVRFQVFGRSIFYFVLEAIADLVILKSYTKASKISSSLIEARLKKECKYPLPTCFNEAINLCLFALEEATLQCQEIQVEEAELVTPIDEELSTHEVDNWLKLELPTQLSILEKVIAEEIRPYIELDDGGVEIVSLKEGLFLTIGYKGACTTCHSSTGSTLNAIQETLRRRVFPGLSVIPDSSWLNANLSS